MLCAHCGIDGQMQRTMLHILPIGLTVLKNDKKAILTASAKAQQALDFLTKAKQVDEALAA
jgi:antirestriction protein ArdC